MFLRFSVWVSLRFIEKNYLVCLGGYFPQTGLFDDSSLKSVVYSLLSPFPSVLCIPISTLDFITIHPVPVASALLILGWSWSTAAESTLSPGQQKDIQLQPSSLILWNQPGWREEGNRELGVERDSRGATPCAWNLILFVCWSFSISIPPSSLSDWYWVTDGSEERIACFWERSCNCFDPGKQTLG